MATLTERDKKVIEMTYKGLLGEAIADSLGISSFTVSNSFRKFGIKAAVVRAAKRNNVSLDKFLAQLEVVDNNILPPPVTDIQSLTLSALASIEKRLASIEALLGSK